MVLDGQDNRVAGVKGGGGRRVLRPGRKQELDRANIAQYCDCDDSLTAD